MKQKLLMPMDLQMFAEGEEGNETPQFSFDDFKAFAESNEDAQKFLQSQSQSAADKQLEAWKANNLEQIKQSTIKEYEDSKKNKSPEQLQLEKLQQDLNAEKALRITNENKAFVAEQIAGLSLDDTLKEPVTEFMLGTLVSDNTEFTQKAVEAFTGVLSQVQQNHQDAIKNLEMQSAFGGNRQPGGQDDTTKIDDPMAALGQQLKHLI